MKKTYFASRTMASIIVGFILLIVWDALWCSATTFRGLSFVGTYVGALFLATLLAIPTLLCHKSWPLLLTWLLMALLLESNLMYVRTYLSWIPLDSYLLIGNLSDFTASIADSLRWSDLLLLAVPIVGFAWIKQRKGAQRAYIKPFIITSCSLGVLGFLISLFYQGMPAHIEKLRNECYYATTPPVIYTLPGAMISEIFLHESTISEADYKSAQEWMAEQERRDSLYPIADRETRKNLVVIFVESLESWPIEAMADGNKEITPVLNRLIADSTTLFLPHVRSQVGSGRSIDAQLLMLAGMHPLDKKVYSMKYPSHTYYTLPQAMQRRDSDTQTILLTSDKPTTWNQLLVARAFGVDTILSRDDWEITEKVGSPAKLSDGAFLRQSVDKLRNGQIWPEGSPAYLHFITYSSHNPFRLQEPLRQIQITGEYPERMTDYMTIINYTDHSLEPLIDYLRNRKDWSETMVVIVGDHEGLGTYRKDWLENPEAAKLLSRESEVPMIVLNSPVAGRIESPIGEVDVFSTIADLMGLRPYAWTGMGQSALNPNRTTPDNLDDHASQAPKQSQTIITYDLLPKITTRP